MDKNKTVIIDKGITVTDELIEALENSSITLHIIGEHYTSYAGCKMEICEQAKKAIKRAKKK